MPRLMLVLEDGSGKLVYLHLAADGKLLSTHLLVPAIVEPPIAGP